MALSSLSQLYWKGEYLKVLNLIEEKLKNRELKLKEKISLQLLKARILVEIGQLEDSKKIIEEINIEKGLRKKEMTKYFIEKKLITIEILFRSKKEEKLNEEIIFLEKFLDEQDFFDFVLRAKAYLALRKATILMRQQLLEDAELWLKKSFRLFKKLEEKRGMSKVLNNLGILYEKKNDFEKALEYFFNSLELKKQIGNIIDIARTLHNIGKTYVSMGEFTKALKYLEQSLSLKEKIGNLSSIALTLNEIGVIYLMRGELDSAENTFKRIYKIRRKLGCSNLATPMINLGLINRYRNKLDEAQKYYLAALKTAKENGEWDLLGTIYYNLIDLEVNRNNKEKAQQYLYELEGILEHYNTKNLKIDYLLAKAVLLKNNPRVIDKAEAQKIYLEIAAIKNLEISKKSEAIIYLCELLFEDYEAFKDKKIIEEIENWLNILENEARKQRSHELLANVLIIEAKLNILNQNLEKAEVFLSQAKALVEELGLLNLEINLSLLYDELAEKKLEEKGEQKQDQAGIQTITFKDLLKTSISKGKMITYQIAKEIPIAFLIVNKEGRILYYKQLGTKAKLDLQKTFQGFILLILSSPDIFALEKQNIGRMIIGSYVFLIKIVRKTLFVYVIKGSSFSAIQKMDAIIESTKASVKLWKWLGEQKTEIKPEISTLLNTIIKETLDYEDNQEEQETTFQILEEDAPKELLKFKSMFHPVKIAILNVMAKNYRISMSDLRKILGIPWGNLQTHLSKMVQDRLIEKRTEFIGDKVKEILYITAQGIDTYNSLKNTLNSFLKT